MTQSRTHNCGELRLADAGGSQSPLNLNLIQPQGQAADHAFLLLIVQCRNAAIIFLGDGIGLKHIVVQLPLGVGGVENQEGDQKHTLIPALQIGQQLFRFSPVGGKVRRKNVHVITGSYGLLLLLNF